METRPVSLIPVASNAWINDLIAELMLDPKNWDIMKVRWLTLCLMHRLQIAENMDSISERVRQAYATLEKLPLDKADTVE